MSSMGRQTIFSLALMAGSALAFPTVVQAQDGARSSLVAQQPTRMDQVVGQALALYKRIEEAELASQPQAVPEQLG